MIGLDMKNYVIILIEKLQKCQDDYPEKLINMNNLQVKKYILCIEQKKLLKNYITIQQYKEFNTE